MMKIDYKYLIMCSGLLVAIAFTMISFGDETYDGIYLLMLFIGGFLAACSIIILRLRYKKSEYDERALFNYGRAAIVAYAYVIAFGAICSMPMFSKDIISYFGWESLFSFLYIGCIAIYFVSFLYYDKLGK